MTLAIVLSFAALVLLATLAVLHSRWPAWMKGLLVAGVAAFYFFADDAVHNLSGWPSSDALPERFALLAAVIEEPSNNGPGALYVWVNAIDKALAAIRAMHAMAFTHVPHPELPGLPRIHAGSVRGGLTRDYHMWRPAFVADCCTLAIDVRTHPGMTVEGVVADLRKCLDGLAAADPDFKYEIEMPPAAYKAPWHAMGVYMPPLELPKDHPLVGITTAHHKAVTGETPRIGVHSPGSMAGADSGHLWSRGVPCFNYGPTQHSRFYNEVVLSKLEHGTRVLAMTAAEVCSRSRDELGYEASWKKAAPKAQG